MYAVLPSRFEPGFGYIVINGPNQCPTPTWAIPRPYPPDLGVSQVSPARWHAPLGRILVLLGLGFRPYRALEGGGAYGAQIGVPWAALQGV